MRINYYRNITIINNYYYFCHMKNLEKGNIYDDDMVQLARFAKALGHPVRLKIIKYLNNQSFCFTGDLVDILPIAQSTVSQHLKELRDAGLIQGEVNPPKTKYCINQENWKIAKALFHDLFDVDLGKIPCSH